MPQNAFFLRTRDLLVSPKMTRRHFLSTLHPLFPVIFAIATVVAFVVLLIVLFGSSRFNFHCYTQREATPTQKSARKWHCDLSQLLAQKITKGIHLCKPTSLNYPIVKLRVGVYIYIYIYWNHIAYFQFDRMKHWTFLSQTSCTVLCFRCSQTWWSRARTCQWSHTLSFPHLVVLLTTSTVVTPSAWAVSNFWSVVQVSFVTVLES